MYNFLPRSTPFAYRKPVNKKIPIVVNLVPADQVWATAVYADRINGGLYFKETQYKDGEITNEPNRTIMYRELDSANVNKAITEADYEMGKLARDWHKGRTLMTAIKRPLSGFEDNLAKAASMDEFALEIHKLEIATIASQIRSYRTGVVHEQRMWGTDTSPLAEVGAKVQCQIEVVKKVFSQQYNCTFVSAITVDTRKVLSFAYNHELDTGAIVTIKGTVKAHRDDSTQLNRVKVL
jgi:hypothetical protein